MRCKMKKEDLLKQYKSYDKIEKMSQKELVNLIENVMILELSPIVPIPYKGKIEQTISYSYPELTANCPMTLIQDLYTVNIIFVPDKFIPELKSLKFYFLDFIGVTISHEHLHAKIFKDFKMAVNPKVLKVKLDVAVRGGIKTDIFYEETK